MLLHGSLGPRQIDMPHAAPWPPSTAPSTAQHSTAAHLVARCRVVEWDPHCRVCATVDPMARQHSTAAQHSMHPPAEGPIPVQCQARQGGVLHAPLLPDRSRDATASVAMERSGQCTERRLTVHTYLAAEGPVAG